jgi:hypothetical protein
MAGVDERKDGHDKGAAILKFEVFLPCHPHH